MTVQELYELLKEFKNEFYEFKHNEFVHLKSKVDWLLYSVISMLIALIVNLILKRL